MKNSFDMLEFISQLVAFSPRQGKNEQRAAKFITSFLEQNNIDYSLHRFKTKIPVFRKETLIADGKEIPCKGSSLVSGKIEDKDQIVSSLIFSDAFINEANINFNPKSDYISLASMYFAPAIAVSRTSLKEIFNAKKVKGEVIVKPYEFESANILVGNRENPRNIVFAHYDSIETGAMDNASGVAVTMQTLFLRPDNLAHTLYIFSGNEELSFDDPTYWGRGFREFEKKYMDVIQGCEKICVVDGLGNGKTIVSQDKNITHLAFPIKNIKKWSDKIFLFYGDLEKLMSVYHSKGDTVDLLKEKYLKEAVSVLIDFLR